MSLSIRNEFVSKNLKGSIVICTVLSFIMSEPFKVTIPHAEMVAKIPSIKITINETTLIDSNISSLLFEL